jgi:2,4-dienoyl-CoA reductase-like NADH-dependent reductase (Old Yellow Enzyme family)
MYINKFYKVIYSFKGDYIMKNCFDKTKIKNMNMKNRFLRGATWEELADDKGHMTSELIKIYKELAEGGVGTIITGYAFVTKDEQPNPGMIGIYDDSFIEEYKKITDMVHSNETNIIMQIAYGGSQTNMKPPSKLIWGPSAVKNESSQIIPTEMNKEDIKTLVKAHGDAALRIKKAGFDGVEIHAAHGYLLSQFLCPHYNRRADEYGGSIENRGRIIFETYEEIRRRVGNDFPIFVKINSQDFIENGLTSEESIIVSKRLYELGIDAIEISGANESAQSVIDNNLGAVRNKVNLGKDRESYFKEHAAKLAQEIDVPVILVGGNRHLDVIEDILNNTKIKYFSLARPLISEPDLINRWASGDTKKPKCISCNQCFKTPGKRCILNSN